MPSLIEGYNYDIFISYRQKDNKGDRWVSEFVEALETELESTFKEDISVYFDINPHDGLLETHDVDESLKEKLKCVVFIPIISRTYCDPKSFAWEHEFKAFIEQASRDQFGLKVKLPNGNVAGRVLPVLIHDLPREDIKFCESILGGVLRGIEFIYKESGFNRPLKPDDDEKINIHKTKYRNQITKVSLSVKEIISGLKIEPIAKVKETSHQKEPLEELHRKERKPKLERPIIITKHKLFSWATFLAILVIAAIFVYPKIFKSKDNLQAMTMTVSIMNENGEKENRRIFKEEYITKLSLFPFGNETNDPSENWLQYGISIALSLDLTQFNYISHELNGNIIHLQEQIKYAKTYNSPYFLTGVFRVTNGIYEITTRLYQTTNGTVKAERVFKGNDFFSLIDSISLQTRIDLNITKSILNSSADLPINEQSTYDIYAFSYYAMSRVLASGDSILHNVYNAIQLDSTFALALFRYASYDYNYQRSYESTQKFITQAMRHRQRLSEYQEISTRIFYYLILGENDKAIALSEMQHELQPNNIQLLLRLIDTYDRNLLVQKLERSWQQLNELLPNIPAYQIGLARSYLLTGKLDKGLGILKQTLKDNPENTDALLQMGEIYLHKNDLGAAEKAYQKAILLSPEDEQYWSKIFTHIAFIRNNSINKLSLQSFTGNYRFGTRELSLISFIHSNYLIIKGANQVPNFMYPVSNNQFISYDGYFTNTFLSNSQGKVIKVVSKQRNMPNPNIIWKEDSLILNARNLLSRGEKTEALSEFRRAYDQNPEHYYLSNYIQHLEFIQCSEYQKLGPVFDSYSGEYGSLKIYKDKSQIYYKNTNGEINLLLPLSKNQFMIPSKFNAQIQIIKDNDSIKGLKFIYRDEKEEFFSRKN
jgi:tetratricopeptide (TPR) repeat protein